MEQQRARIRSARHVRHLLKNSLARYHSVWFRIDGNALNVIGAARPTRFKGRPAYRFNKLATILSIGDQHLAWQSRHRTRELAIAAFVEAAEIVDEPRLERFIRGDARRVFLEPAAGLDLRQPDWHGTIRGSFVNPVWKQPCRVLAALVIVNRPNEVDVSINLAEVGRIAIRAEVANVGPPCDCLVEIGKDSVGWTPPNNHLHRTFQLARDRTQDFQTLAAANHSEPANTPRG